MGVQHRKLELYVFETRVRQPLSLAGVPAGDACGISLFEISIKGMSRKHETHDYVVGGVLAEWSGFVDLVMRSFVNT